MRLVRSMPILLSLGLMFLAQPAAASGPEEWSAFKARFVTDDGRVVDIGNKSISHTEGQGYAMLCAAVFDDQPTFRLVWQWTRDHLPRRPDGLFPWRWTPAAGGGGAVTDPNNATDGDIVIAWALARAAARWNDAGLRGESAALAKAILDAAVRRIGSLTVLLPGASGFERKDAVVLNLSYWIFPAFPALDAVAPSPLWAALGASGTRLIAAARFGTWELPPDWLQLALDGSPERRLSQRLKPASGFPPTFGYDAIRVPLYLVWGGVAGREYLDPFVRLWSRYPSSADIPARIDLATGVASPYPLSRGGQAIVALVRRAAGSSSAMTPDIGLLPSDDYYSSALLLLARIAAAERADR